jgi:hypothetical protein
LNGQEPGTFLLRYSFTLTFQKHHLLVCCYEEEGERGPNKLFIGASASGFRSGTRVSSPSPTWAWRSLTRSNTTSSKSLTRPVRPHDTRAPPPATTRHHHSTHG